MGIEMCDSCGGFVDTDSEEMYESSNKKYDNVCDSCSQDEYDEEHPEILEVKA